MRWAWVTLVLAAGCATSYVPKASGDIKQMAPPGWAPKGSISLVNSQQSSEDFTIGKQGDFEPVTTNLREWTDVVIHYATDLVKQAPGIVKSITMRITGVTMTPGQYAGLIVVVRPTCDVELEVVTGGGYHAVYRAGGKTFYSWGSACEDATREVAAQVFSDIQILKYLNE